MTSRLTGAATVGFILITSSLVHGQQNTVIQACVNKSSGEVKIVSTPAQCKVNERLLTWQTATATDAEAAELAALTERVAKLEGQITGADLAGTYSLFVFENHLASPAHSSGGVRFQEFTGTVTVDANGNGSYNISGFAGANLTLAGLLDASPNGGPITGNFTASYANGVVTVVNFAGGTFTMNVAVGGRVFVGIVPTFDAVNERFTDSLVLMTRLQ